MSVVWRAYDEALGRPVAVKLLTARYVAHASSRDRIRTEAQAAAVLSHPHITSVHDYGESPTAAGEPTPYVVMELLTGPTLAERLRSGPLPVRTALQVAAQVASALAAAHGSGLVHRDVKPGNVMLTPTGAKVLDFGLAAPVGERDEVVAGGEVWGTPAYLAPERLTGGQVVPASDVYALGLLLYVGLTGRKPWPARTVQELLDAHRYREPDPLPPIAGLPPEVVALCRRCLAKDPVDRPAAHEAARVLAGAVGWRVGAPVPPRPGPLADRLTPVYSHRLPPGAVPDRVRTPVPAAAPAPVELDPFPTGPTVAYRPDRRPPVGSPPWWRAVALAGSTAAVIVSATAGLWVIGGDPGRLPATEQGAAGLGTAVFAPTPTPTVSSPTGIGAAAVAETGRPAPADRPGHQPGDGEPGTGGGMPGATAGAGSSGSGAGSPGSGPTAPGSPGTSSPGGGSAGPMPGPTSPASTPPDSGSGSTDPTTSPSPTPDPVSGSWQPEGGTVSAECAADQARLLSWAPDEGYAVGMVVPGPALQVSVEFTGPGTVTVVIQCVSGAPVATIS